MGIHKKYSLFTLLIIVITIVTFLYSCKEKNPQKFRFHLQPFEKARILVNNVELPFKIISTDNTLGLLEIELQNKVLKQKHSLNILHEAYNPINHEIDITKIDYPPTFIFDKENQSHKYIKYIKTGSQPKSVSFLDNEHISVPLLNDLGIDIININTGEVKRTQPPPPWVLKKGFVETLVISKQREFWVSQMPTNSIHVFDLDNYDYKQTININGIWPKVLVYDSLRDYVYSTNWRSNDISIIDLHTKKSIDKIHLGQIPRGLSISTDNNYLYVCQYSDSAMAKIDLKENESIKNFGEAGSKRHVVMTKNGKLIYVSDLGANRIEVYSTDNDSLIKEIQVFDKPNTITLSPDEKYLYVSCRGPNHPTLGYMEKGLEMGKIYVINTKTFEVDDFWEAGNQPTGLAVSPDGKHLVFSDFLDHAVRVYSTQQ